MGEKDIRTSFDGKLWIMTKRHKTIVNANIPLLDVAKQILDKYRGKFSDEETDAKLSINTFATAV